MKISSMLLGLISKNTAQQYNFIHLERSAKTMMRHIKEGIDDFHNPVSDFFRTFPSSIMQKRRKR